MTTHFPLTACALLTILAARGQSTIAPARAFIWGANAGWLSASIANSCQGVSASGTPLVFANKYYLP